MASIVLSFVGSQDPYSKNHDEGSIVSIVKHFCEQQEVIKNILLLYTKATRQNAIDTQDWLLLEVKTLTKEAIVLFSVADAFSQDPINQLLAVQEARQAIEQAQRYKTEQDTLVFNGSSGTPAMKACWSILQASGYASSSHVWQVRNPKEMQPGQARVFRNDVNVLKNEFDLKVIRQQVRDYNYNGALISFNASHLRDETIAALLHYGYYRISLDFNRAFSALNVVSHSVDPQWNQEIADLRQQNKAVLLKEAYFNAEVRFKNREYSDFLVGLSRFQESVLRYLVTGKLNLAFPESYSETDRFWQAIRQVDQGTLYRSLQAYRFRENSLTLEKFPNRPVMIAILEQYREFSGMMPLISDLNEYCEQRNRIIHQFQGISELKDGETILMKMRQILKRIMSIPSISPFDVLNQQLTDLLDALHGLEI